jgi:hypothetical protein
MLDSWSCRELKRPESFLKTLPPAFLSKDHIVWSQGPLSQGHPHVPLVKTWIYMCVCTYISISIYIIITWLVMELQVFIFLLRSFLSFHTQISVYLSFFFFFWWDWSLNSGICAWKAGALPLEPHFQSILLWLFWRWGITKYLPRLA